jgi:hypothetical protein
VLTSQETELISVKLQLNRAKSIIISSFYRPPNMTEDTYSSAALEELIKSQKNQINATYSNISAISWRPVLVVEEARVPGENHRPWASNW